MNLFSKNKIEKFQTNEKGSVLAYVLVIVSIVSVILLSSVQFIISEVKYSLYNSSREESFQIAEAGVYFYYWYLNQNTEGKTAAQIEDFWKNDNPLGTNESYEAEYKNFAGEAIGKYILEVTPPIEGSTSIKVKSTAFTYQYPDAQRTITVRFRHPSWSEYVVLGNDSMRFEKDADVYGKVFSNSGIHFDGVAHHMVFSAVNSYFDNDLDVDDNKAGVWTSWSNEYNTDMHSPVFLAGKKYPVIPKEFSAIDFDSMKKRAINLGTYYDDTKDGMFIRLEGDKYDIRLVTNHLSPDNEAIFSDEDEWSLDNPIPDNGVIFVDKNVWLEGTLGTNMTDKKLTVVAGNSGSIFIGKDIQYYNSLHDGKNILGIVAQNNIEIIKNSQTNLHIDGALLAQAGRVGRIYYEDGCDCNESFCQDYKESITVYGAIVSNQRYKFDWQNECPDGAGYADINIYFDNNLLYFPPPYFPTGMRYLLDLWEES